MVLALLDGGQLDQALRLTGLLDKFTWTCWFIWDMNLDLYGLFLGICIRVLQR